VGAEHLQIALRVTWAQAGMPVLLKGAKDALEMDERDERHRTSRDKPKSKKPAGCRRYRGKCHSA